MIDVCFVVRGPALVMDHADEPFLQMFGDREPLGRPLLESFPELAYPGLAPAILVMREVMRTGQPARLIVPSRFPQFVGEFVELEMRACLHDRDRGVAVLYRVPRAAIPGLSAARPPTTRRLESTAAGR